MRLKREDLPDEVLALLAEGAVIPAHPLALDARRRLDVARQNALTRYYIDAGAGGLAVGVHTTQFAIREAGLYEIVLRSAMATKLSWSDRPMIMIAGVCGQTAQACAEAALAASTGYHAALLSLAQMGSASDDELLAHCRRVAEEIPLVGFYLQPAVGGRPLSSAFWRGFAAIQNVVAVKAAPFNRYASQDVVRGIVEAHAEERIFLYSGNDDHIILDLVTPLIVMRDHNPVSVAFRGGLLGHWAFWTSKAVEQLAQVKRETRGGQISRSLLELASRVTECNAAIFDVAHAFQGCVPGCHEILRRQGLLEGIWCLDPRETLSPGQSEEIDRVCRDHCDLQDDEFVRQNLDRWLKT